MSDQDRIDFSALDPEADPARLERTARAVAARLALSLAGRRAHDRALWLQLVGWRRPVLAAGALVAAASIVVLAMPRVVPVKSAAPGTLAEAEGLPAPVAGWVESGTPPSNDALLGLRERP